jgi:hypothetical protein
VSTNLDRPALTFINATDFAKLPRQRRSSSLSDAEPMVHFELVPDVVCGTATRLVWWFAGIPSDPSESQRRTMDVILKCPALPNELVLLREVEIRLANTGYTIVFPIVPKKVVPTVTRRCRFFVRWSGRNDGFWTNAFVLHP